MYQPRPYQAKALRAIAKTRMAGEKRALVVMASGLGKTVVAGFDIRRFLRANPGAKVLYLCHRNPILEQAREELTENILPAKYSHGFMQGDIKDIRGVDVLYATFQTMASHRTLFRRGEFDYIVVDESHHGPAETYLPTLKYFRPKFMLAVTATPERMDQQDITKIYGEHVFSLELEEAWTEGLLTPVDYRVVTDEWQNLKVLQSPIGRLSITQLNKTIFVPKRDEEVIRIIDEKLDMIPSPSVMIFSPRIEHCEHLVGLMDGAVAIHSRLTTREQTERLAAFRRGEYRAVITVDKFNEGIDVPEANVVVFLRSTASRTIFFQQLGRGLRLSEGKKQVVVLDFVANCDRLVMLEELQRGANAKLTRLHHVPADSPIMVDAGEFEFNEVVQDVLRVIAQIRQPQTRDSLIASLRLAVDEIGHAPTLVEYNALTPDKYPSLVTIVRYFGSFYKALRAAGITPPRKSPRQWTRQELLEQLIRLADVYGRDFPNSLIDQEADTASINTFISEFGSMSAARKLANLPVPMEHLSREEMLARLKSLCADLGWRTATRPEFIDATKRGILPSYATYHRKFGGLPNAYKLVGLDQQEAHGIVLSLTDELLLDPISRLLEKRRTPILVAELEDLYKSGEIPAAPRTYFKRLGGIRTINERAGWRYHS